MPRPPVKLIDVRKALKLRLKGMAYGDIGQAMGCTASAVHQALKPFLAMVGSVEHLDAYKEHKADVLDGVQLTLARDLLDKDKRAKATLGNVAYAIRQLNDITRLERDQSTANIAYAHADAMRTVQEVDAEIAKLTTELSNSAETAPVSPTMYKDDVALATLEQEIAKVTGADTAQDVDTIEDTE